MDFNTIMTYMSQYGILFLIVIVFLEYLNLPGFPAGVILPVTGILIASSEMNFWIALIASSLSALAASWAFYFVGRYGGDFLLQKYMKRFPKHRPYIEKKMLYLKEKGSIGVFISKLIPMARTIIAIPAGAVQINFLKYTVSSALGILIWNVFFIAAGYFFGQEIVHLIK
ncbi:DedA family protein [Paludicola sp. MB14-C6]|uniref:DedA family protein n=1 Tax=Paludihabitans sp. MB14-C6 TaxID=3070656 RepID=UPI0027DBD246|nr:DedA family protein [Paludicola sp. MB14-C6]WMJ22730.1 DedA family protein [Paludicola sp. MB14-C6]